MFRLTVCHVTSALLLFPFFYALNLNIGPIALDNIFKAATLLCLVVLVAMRPFKGDALTGVLALRAMKNVFIAQDPMLQITNGIDFVRNLLSAYIYSRFRQSTPEKCYDFLSWMTVLTVIFSLPFHLHLVPQLGAGYDLSIYGLDDLGYVGVFSNPQNATVTHGIASLFLLNFIMNSNTSHLKKGVSGLLYCVSVISVYLTYVRIGWLIVGGGSCVICTTALVRRRQYGLLLLGVCLACLAAIPLLSSQVFMDRIFDTNMYEKNTTDGTLASGRFLFWAVAFDLFKTGSEAEQIFGIGRDNMMEYMARYFGIFIVGHNGFIDALVQNGLVGAVIDIAYVSIISLRLLHPSEVLPFELRLSLLIAYFTVYLFQGGYFFYFDIYINAVCAMCFVARTRKGQPLRRVRAARRGSVAKPSQRNGEAVLAQTTAGTPADVADVPKAQI